MPTIDPDLIPSITPGNIFDALTTDDSLNVRWLVPTEPVYYEAINRPMGDITVRQLIIAKALDAIELRLSHQALFPFLITCKVQAGTSIVETPQSWIWDMHVSLPSKWQYIRLAKIKRMSGTNATTITGVLRLVFTGQLENSATEVALFEADYQIDSNFTYQIKRVTAVTSTEEPTVIDPGEAGTVDGFIIFRTLPQDNESYYAFLEKMAPPIDTTDSNSDGFYDTPAEYEILSSEAAGETNQEDFLSSALSHGTGMLVASATNLIPDIASNLTSWLEASNYPFRLTATRTSLDGIIVPKALFREFNMVVPTFDEPTGDATHLNSPVWLSSIEKLDINTLQFKFSTYSLVPTPTVVEFATMNLDRSWVAGRVVKISPSIDLLEEDNVLYQQGFGTGHVVLASIWGDTSGDIDVFFNAFSAIITLPTETVFTKEAGMLSSFSLSRVPRTVPTTGESEALAGTTARRLTPIPPSDTNRYVNEQDQGLGDPVDFRLQTGFTENQDIDDIGYTGSKLSQKVRLDVDTSGTAHDYNTHILPRLRCLLGRDPIFGDMWYDGTMWKVHNGDAWQSI